MEAEFFFETVVESTKLHGVGSHKTSYCFSITKPNKLLKSVVRI
jgi:hypothetical protein